MKIVLLTTFVITHLVGNCFAGTSVLPDIPVSQLGLSNVLGIVKQQINTTNFTVVAIDWHIASTFQPRIGDANYHPGEDHPNEYSWFVTYIYRDEIRSSREVGIKRQFNSVGVIRIKDDGRIGKFVGVQ